MNSEKVKIDKHVISRGGLSINFVLSVMCGDVDTALAQMMRDAILQLGVENQSLRDELEAVKAEHDAMELTYMTTKQSLNKIKADAIREAISESYPFYSGDLGDDIVIKDRLIEHANQVEKGRYCRKSYDK